MNAQESGSFQALVVGGGAVGWSAAVMLAQAGLHTALLAPSAPVDTRTTALLGGSVAALEAAGIWGFCREFAAPLRAIRIIDDRGGFVRAPEVLFEAHEIEREAFGYNVENLVLLSASRARATALPTLRVIEAGARNLALGPDAVTVETAGATLRTKLLAAADGRSSLCRAAAGIGVEQRAHDQAAITCNLRHRRAHDDTSTEFHTRNGPFTLVPLTGDRSSLVWVTNDRHARELVELSDPLFAEAAERQAHSLLGAMQVDGARGYFPLVTQTAHRLVGERLALLGEAAHVLPPIGAQGLNLGLRDAIAIAAVAATHADDPGSPDALADYERRRSADVRNRTLAVDALNQSLMADFLPVQLMRRLGLTLVQRIGPLRRALMRQGLGPEA